MHLDNILEQIKTRHRVSRLMALLIGTFIVGLLYNAFVVPNNVVYGGVGGIAIVVNQIFNIPTTLFLNFLTLLLIIISLLLLGFKKTSYTIIGYIFYMLMINLTAPFAKYINIEFDSFLLSIVVHGFIAGIGNGLIYRAGFNTGGSDSIIAISQKYFRFPTARLSNIINGLIILLGATTFGIEKSLYAIIYLKIMNFISDAIILGLSNSKICFIKSHYNDEIEHYLSNELEVGYTIIDSTNGIGFLNKGIIMCVVPTDRFYDLKHEVITLDKRATLIANDCYTVIGGRVNGLIPF